MFGISEFFKKIQGSYTKEILIRNAIKEAILHQTGADIPITAVIFKSDTVMLTGVSQSLKSAIYIKKQAILKEIADKQDVRVVNDIR
jgi:hypothetical protein